MLLLGRFSVLIQGRVLFFVCLFVFALFVSQGLLILSSNFGFFGSIGFYTIRNPIQMQIEFGIFTSALKHFRGVIRSVLCTFVCSTVKK